HPRWTSPMTLSAAVVIALAVVFGARAYFAVRDEAQVAQQETERTKNAARVFHDFRAAYASAARLGDKLNVRDFAPEPRLPVADDLADEKQACDQVLALYGVLTDSNWKEAEIV